MGRRSIPCLAVIASLLAVACAPGKSSLTAPDYQAARGEPQEDRRRSWWAPTSSTCTEGADRPPTPSRRRSAPPAPSRPSSRRSPTAATRPWRSRSTATTWSSSAPTGRSGTNSSTRSPRTRRSSRESPPCPCAQASARRTASARSSSSAPATVTSRRGGRAVFWDQALLRVYFGRGAAYADLSALDCTGRIIHYGQQSGRYCSLSSEEGVHTVFDELVSGLPQAGRQ